MSDILDKINQICRVCLLEQSMMHSVFNQNDSYQEIFQMLNDFTTIKIDLNDNLPQLVCSSCLERLGIAFSFKQDCERSDQILRKLVLENEDKFDTKQFITYNTLLQNEENFAVPDFETRNISEFVKVEIQDDINAQEESIKTERDEDDVLQLSALENESDDRLRKPKKIITSNIDKNQRNHVCPICGAAYHRPSRLQQHLQRHTGIKEFACKLCDHRTTTEFLLRGHMRTHTGERPFVCDICKKTFAYKCYLTIHKRLHTGVKPYKCTFSPCRRVFATKQAMKVHERSHTGEKLYHCQICDRKFATLQNLKYHKTKHGDSENT